MNDIWKQNYTHILISVKFLGIYWELWSEMYIFGETPDEFFHSIKNKYKTKFGKREFNMKLIYPSHSYNIKNK